MLLVIAYEWIGAISDRQVMMWLLMTLDVLGNTCEAWSERMSQILVIPVRESTWIIVPLRRGIDH